MAHVVTRMEAKGIRAAAANLAVVVMLADFGNIALRPFADDYLSRHVVIMHPLVTAQPLTNRITAASIQSHAAPAANPTLASATAA